MIRVIGWKEGRQAQGEPLGGIAAAGLETWLRRERFMYDVAIPIPDVLLGIEPLDDPSYDGGSCR